MKKRGQVQQKIKQARFRHMKRELASLLSETPENCKNNRRAKTSLLDVGICSLDCQVCDSKFDDRSGECGEFELRHDAEDLKSSLKDFFNTRSIAELAVRFPDVAALQWTLDEEEGELFPSEHVNLFGVSVLVPSEMDRRALQDGHSQLMESFHTLNQVRVLLREEVDDEDFDVTDRLIATLELEKLYESTLKKLREEVGELTERLEEVSTQTDDRVTDLTKQSREWSDVIASVSQRLEQIKNTWWGKWLL